MTSKAITAANIKCVYHGTSASIATALATSGISVSKGGGELGVGFYTGEHLHVAKRWAFHRHGETQNNVVEIEVDEEEMLNLDIVALSAPEAAANRINIKRSESTRTHTFGCDLVWSPIVGTDKILCDQFKWESSLSETKLNDSAWKKNIK